MFYTKTIFLQLLVFRYNANCVIKRFEERKKEIKKGLRVARHPNSSQTEQLYRQTNKVIRCHAFTLQLTNSIPERHELTSLPYYVHFLYLVYGAKWSAGEQFRRLITLRSNLNIESRREIKNMLLHGAKKMPSFTWPFICRPSLQKTMRRIWIRLLTFSAHIFYFQHKMHRRAAPRRRCILCCWQIECVQKKWASIP